VTSSIVNLVAQDNILLVMLISTVWQREIKDDTPGRKPCRYNPDGAVV